MQTCLPATCDKIRMCVLFTQITDSHFTTLELAHFILSSTWGQQHNTALPSLFPSQGSPPLKGAGGLCNVLLVSLNPDKGKQWEVISQEQCFQTGDQSCFIRAHRSKTFCNGVQSPSLIQSVFFCLPNEYNPNEMEDKMVDFGWWSPLFPRATANFLHHGLFYATTTEHTLGSEQLGRRWRQTWILLGILGAARMPWVLITRLENGVLWKC